MFVGVATITIKIPYSSSLKEKRSVVNKIKRRVANSFPVSISEVGDLDYLNSAVIGFSLVSNDKNIIYSKIEKIFNFINEKFDIIVMSEDFDILKF